MDAKSVVIVDPDSHYRGLLSAAMARLGISAHGYDSLSIGEPEALQHAGYVLGLAPQTTPTLVQLLRRRGQPAILVASDGAKTEAVQAAIDGCAAQHVTKLKAIQDVAASIAATMRQAWARGGVVAWRLNRGVRQLVAPDGARIDLSLDELGLMACFATSAGSMVSRSALLGALPPGPGPASPDPVHAALLRMQRRAERLTPISLPFKAWTRAGYSFQGRLDEA